MTTSVATSSSNNAEQVTKLVFLTYDELPDGDPDDLKVLAEAGKLGLETGVLDWRKVELGAAFQARKESAQEKNKDGDKVTSRLALSETAPQSGSATGTVYVLRSTWDYHLYYEEFQAFLEQFLGTNQLVNDAQLVLWNTDKRYLQDLALCGIPVAPTLICSASQFSQRWKLEAGAFKNGSLSASPSEVGSWFSAPSSEVSFSSPPGSASGSVVSTLEFPCSLEDFTERIKTLGWTDIVVKPARGLSSYGVKRFQLNNLESAAEEYEHAFAHAQKCSLKSPVLVQPYLASVNTLGERCLVFIDGEYSHAIMKKPFQHMAVAGDAGEVPLEATVAEVEFASRVLAQLPVQPLYARVDFVQKEEGVTAESGLEPGRERAGTASGQTNGEANEKNASDFYLLELELVEPSLYFCFKEAAVNRFAQALR